MRAHFLDGLRVVFSAIFLVSLWRTFALPMRGQLMIPTFFSQLFTTFLALFAVMILFLLFPRTDDSLVQSDLRQRVIDHPGQARFAWDLAQGKLEAYFDRNLEQVKFIFFAAVLTMIAGFGLVSYGVMLAIAKPETIRPSLVAAGSGILTEFIAATFLVIYRSSMAQASSYMNVLERINTVGMAVQILDSIPEENVALKNETRANMTKLLLEYMLRTKKRYRNSK